MSFEFYTMVKASPGFWETLLMKQLGDEKYARIDSIKEDEIIITKNHDDALDEIIRLSREYPDEVFRVKIASENIYENYVFLYECSGGKAKPIKEGYEYCFGINTYDRDRLPDGLFEKFRKTVADYYSRVYQDNQQKIEFDINFDDDKNSSDGKNNRNEKNYKNDKIDESSKNDNITVLVRYETPKVCLTARKLGLTFVDVQVEFNEKEKSRSEKIETQTDFDDCPF